MYILEMTDYSTVLNFTDFNLLNESHTFGKKNLGIIGPLANWSMKIQAYPEPNNGMIGYAMDEDEIELFHGDKKLRIPSKSCDVQEKPDYSIIEIKPHTKWIDSDSSREQLEDFIEDYINTRSKKERDPASSVSDDIEIVMDLIGISEKVKSCNYVKENFFEADLENGMQIEVKKGQDDDLFKTLKIYKDNLSNFPDVKIKRSGVGKVGEFRTKMGEFSETGDSISDLLKQPCTKYLLQHSLGNPDEQTGEDLLNHYKKLLRHHEFKNEASSFNASKHEMEKKEINRLKQILRNSVSERDLEKIYNEFRNSK
jgi:hypothetical protein